ncbi:hypothetical protein ACMFMF_003835 [Clarireedia jacksonii]
MGQKRLLARQSVANVLRILPDTLACLFTAEQPLQLPSYGIPPPALDGQNHITAPYRSLWGLDMRKIVQRSWSTLERTFGYASGRIASARHNSLSATFTHNEHRIYCIWRRANVGRANMNHLSERFAELNCSVAGNIPL